MADKIIQNPSITPNDFGYDGGAISSILGAPLVGAGGGTIIESDFVWLPSVTDEGVISWQRATSATAPSTANIKGPQGNPGANGTNGTAGFSPTVSTTTTASEYRTGTVLTFTYGDEGGQTVSYTAWNGKDGTGTTVDLLEGTGIQITRDGTTYTISVSADYALKSELPDVTDMATMTWVEQQSYFHTSGGTVSGKTTVSGSEFNILEVLRGGQASTGIIGINSAGGMSFKAVNSNNNTQLNIAPNATMDKRFSIGDDVYNPSAYFIPAVTANTTAGLIDDGILHIIVEN